MTGIRLSLPLLLTALALAGAPSPDKQPDPVALSNLKAGVASVDITPAVGIPLAGYADRLGPSTGIHDPLRAAVAVLDDGTNRAAIVTLDVLSVEEAGADEIRAELAKIGIPPDHVLINYSHTHGSPSLKEDAGWRREVISKTVGAVRLAQSRLRPVSLGYGEGAIDFNINRRVITPEGKCIAGLNPAGLVDRRVKVLRLDDSDSLEPVAVLFHAVCHANVYRARNTEITADFPGIAKTFVERNFGARTTALFLQGATGDVRANLPGSGAGYTNNTADFGRSGNETDMTWCAWSLGSEAVKVAARLRVREKLSERASHLTISGAAQMLKITADMELHQRARHPRNKVTSGNIDFPVRALRIGDIWLVSLPGEPVVEYGLKIEEMMKGYGKVIVLGYTSGDAGYVPAAHMIKEGGYEVEDGAYSEASEGEILDGVKRLVARLAAN